MLSVLRDELGLSGPKFGCGQGECGACMVLVDGQPQTACNLPVWAVQDAQVTTLEGLGTPEHPHPVQTAFIEERAAQCGYCVAGIITVRQRPCSPATPAQPRATSCRPWRSTCAAAAPTTAWCAPCSAPPTLTTPAPEGQPCSMNWLFPKIHTPTARAASGSAVARACPSLAGGGGGATRAPRRAPVVIRGQRARTVDVHAHCYFQAALDLMGAEAKAVLPPVKGVPEHFLQHATTALAQRLDAMDRMGIDLQVLSINPFWYRQDRDTAEAICRVHNESLAELCARHPKRFAAFASLAMQFPGPGRAAA